MKRSILTIFTISALLVSCETTEKKDDNKGSEKTVEISKDAYLDFNDDVVMQVGIAQDELNKLNDLDAQDVPEESMILAALDAKSKLENILIEVQKLQPVGEGSAEYYEAAVGYLKTTISVAQVYHDFAASLSITEDLWDEQQIMEWMNMAEPEFMDYKDAFEYLGLMQSNFAAYQNIEITPLIEEAEIEEVEEITLEEPILENV